MGQEDGHRKSEEATGKAQENERQERKRQRAGPDAHEVERWEARRCAQEYQAAAKLVLVTKSRRRRLDPPLHALAWDQPDPATRVIHPDLAKHLAAGPG